MSSTTLPNTTTKYAPKMGVATREAYGQALVELGKVNPNVIVLDADLAKSTFSASFQKVFPERFFTVGIAEANMVSIAAGLALAGKLPFASSFAVFICDKGFDQLRVGAAYPHVNAKYVGSHGGISIGEDGPEPAVGGRLCAHVRAARFCGAQPLGRILRPRAGASHGGTCRPGLHAYWTPEDSNHLWPG